MDPLRIAVRSLLAFAYLAVLTRASGKRVVGEATPFDFVLALIIGDLIDDALWAEVSLAKFGAAAGSIVALDIFIKLGAARWTWLLKIIDGTPSIVVRDGVEDRDELRREQLNEGDLDHYLRLEGVEKREEVRLALIERDHEMSVLPTHACEPAKRADAAKVLELAR